MSFTILSCGRDPLLLSTRSLILSCEGFRVITATDATEAHRVLAAGNIDLILLCHSLNEREFQSILAAARALRRRPSILTLAPNKFSPLTCETNSVVDIGNGPGQLLAAVRGVIGHTSSRDVDSVAS